MCTEAAVYVIIPKFQLLDQIEKEIEEEHHIEELKNKWLEEDYKYIMFQKLFEMGGETIEDNDDLKAAVKANLKVDLKDDDEEPPKLSAEAKAARKEKKEEIKKLMDEKLALRRIGEIRDFGKAKSEGYPEDEMSKDILIDIFKAIKDPSLDEMELKIKGKVYILQPVEKEPDEGEPSEPRVWKTEEDDGFAAIRSNRSLLVAFFDPSKKQRNLRDAEKYKDADELKEYEDGEP